VLYFLKFCNISRFSPSPGSWNHNLCHFSLLVLYYLKFCNISRFSPSLGTIIYAIFHVSFNNPVIFKKSKRLSPIGVGWKNNYLASCVTTLSTIVTDKVGRKPLLLANFYPTQLGLKIPSWLSSPFWHWKLIHPCIPGFSIRIGS
jgi:hypothetical protein